MKFAPKLYLILTIPLLMSVPACTFIAEIQPSATPSLTPTPIPTATPEPTSTNTPQPTATKYIDTCISWTDVTVSMAGETVCVQAVIEKLVWTYPGTRYKFSDKPNTFFLYSRLHYFYDTKTKKPIGAGSCVIIEGEVLIEGDIPYVNLNDAYDHRRLTFFPDSECP